MTQIARMVHSLCSFLFLSVSLPFSVSTIVQCSLSRLSAVVLVRDHCSLFIETTFVIVHISLFEGATRDKRRKER